MLKAETEAAAIGFINRKHNYNSIDLLLVQNYDCNITDVACLLIFSQALQSGHALGSS